MKKIISLLLALCLLAGCSLAGAESAPLQGKPWVNSNLFGQWPEECPGPEESYDLFANYAFYRETLEKDDRSFFAALYHGEDVVLQQYYALCEDPSFTRPESEILRILYGLYMNTEKRNQEGLAPLQPYETEGRSFSFHFSA